MNIYLDTNLWNLLCDQGADPQQLVASLAAQNTNLVLSPHIVFEIAKTFRSTGEQALERGKELFSYLKKFLNAGVLCSKDTMELLTAEMSALKTGAPIETLLSTDDHDRLNREIDKLASGNLDEQADNFITRRVAFGAITRSSQVNHLQTRTDVKEDLKSVTPENLDNWLQSKTKTQEGVALLGGHIKRMFPNAPVREVAEYALFLIASPDTRVSPGLVRADIYYNWRCANRDSNPKDLTDDMYHVLNSTYCDVYATEEKKQLEYARLLLTPNTRVAIYDRQTPLASWLENLAQGLSP